MEFVKNRLLKAHNNVKYGIAGNVAFNEGFVRSIRMLTS